MSLVRAPAALQQPGPAANFCLQGSQCFIGLLIPPSALVLLGFFFLGCPLSSVKPPGARHECMVGGVQASQPTQLEPHRLASSTAPERGVDGLLPLGARIELHLQPPIGHRHHHESAQRFKPLDQH